MAIKREIKFRAWDKEMSKMIQPNHGDFIGWHAPSNWEKWYEVMQYTGKKDKNGVEIYEDDIIIDEKGRYGLVYWNLEDLEFAVDFQADMEIEYISGRFAVCGNSWENVNLLK